MLLAGRWGGGGCGRKLPSLLEGILALKHLIAF